MPPNPPKNGLGVASLIVGVVALAASVTLIGGVVLGLVALIIGLAARSRVRRGEATNGGVAIAGIVLGTFATVVPVIIVLVLVFGTEAFNEDYLHCIGYHPGHEESCAQYR